MTNKTTNNTNLFKGISGRAMQVLNAIVTRGAEGATSEEIVQLTGLPHQTASARINELAFKHGRIKASGRYRTNTRNRNCIVWTVP
jgi:DNA-binding IclR family transcriptional regulator